MKKGRILGLLALGLAIAPAISGAAPITWRYSGVFNNAGGDVPLGLGVGSPYTLTVTLDDSAPIEFPCAPGAGGRIGDVNCIRQYQPASIAIELDIGRDCDEVAPGDQNCTSGVVNLAETPRFLRIGNDYINPPMFPVPTDFISYRFYEVTEYDATHWLRWTFFLSTTDTSAFDGLGIPSALPPGALLNWGVCTARKFDDPTTDGTNETGFCDTSKSGTDDPYFRLDDTLGVIPAVAVPEPGSLALLGLGLVGLGLGRRRKAA